MIAPIPAFGWCILAYLRLLVKDEFTEIHHGISDVLLFDAKDFIAILKILMHLNSNPMLVK